MGNLVKKGMAALVGVALISAAGLAQAETRFAVQDPTGTTDKFVVTDSGTVGINIANPVYKLHLVGTGEPSTAAVLVASPGRATGYLATDSGGFSFMRNNHSTVNAGLPRVNDRLGYFGFGSYIGTGYKWLSTVQVYSEANATATSAPTYLTFGTSGATGFNAVERMRINSSGNVGIGTNAPSQKLEVAGGLRLNTATAKPATCNASARGVIWVSQGATGVADTVDICLKDASGNYAWKTL